MPTLHLNSIEKHLNKDVIKINQELYHHGVKGMKWGVRHDRMNSSGDRILKKGSKFYRIDLTENGQTFDNKKYLSTNRKDHKKWTEYLGTAYIERGKAFYELKYKTMKDIKVMTATKSGEEFTKKCLKDPDFQKAAIRDTQTAQNMLRYKINDRDAKEVISLNIAAQTETGKRFIEYAMTQGYGGIEDQHGKNVSKDPLILFDPDNSLKLKKSKRLG